MELQLFFGAVDGLTTKVIVMQINGTLEFSEVNELTDIF
jgi:hypothetical protein